MAIRRVTMEEIRNLPPLTEERIKEIKDFKEDFSDPECPRLTPEQINKGKRSYEVHPEWYKPRKSKITIMVDNDILAALKSEGKGYQTKINSILRKAVLGA